MDAPGDIEIGGVSGSGDSQTAIDTGSNVKGKKGMIA